MEETRQRQKNMDKAEDEQDKKERAEGLAEKKRILEAYKKEKAENYEENKVKVQSVKKATDPAIIAEAKKWASEQRVGSAEDKRKQFSALKSIPVNAEEKAVPPCVDVDIDIMVRVFEVFTCSELKDLLRLRSLSAAGNKHDVKKRLANFCFAKKRP